MKKFKKFLKKFSVGFLFIVGLLIGIIIKTLTTIKKSSKGHDVINKNKEIENEKETILSQEESHRSYIVKKLEELKELNKDLTPDEDKDLNSKIDNW